MSWMLPSVILTLSGTLVLFLVYLHLYMQNKERYLAIWTAGWAVFALRFIVEILMMTTKGSAVLLIANQLFNLGSGFLLLWGTYEFAGRKLQKKCLVITSLGAIWIVAGVLLSFSFMLLSLPIFILYGLISIKAGLQFLALREAQGFGAKITGWAFIVWGVHKMDYPFLRPLVWIAPWGYFLSAMLELIVAVGILLTYLQKANDDLVASEKRYRGLVELSPDGVVISQGGYIVFANPRASAILGARKPDDLLGRHIMNFVHPDYHSIAEQRIQQIMQGGSVAVMEQQFVRVDGELVDVEVCSVMVAYDGKPSLQSVFLDITSRKQADEDSRFKSMLLDRATDSVFVHDLSGKFVYVNEAAYKDRGYTKEELMAMSLQDLNSPESAKHVAERVSLVKKQGSAIIEATHIKKDGTLMPVEVHAMLIERNGKEFLVGIARDMTERKLAEEKAEYLAYYDSLTGLPNRLLLNDRLSLALAHAHRSKEMLSLMYLDLDSFKTINDTLGHDMGDRLLRDVAERLQRCLREGDTVARIGGDEFVVLLPQISSTDDVAKVAEKVIEQLKPSFDYDGRELHITTSIGITLYPHDGSDVQTLFKNAEVALYRAKEQGRNNYQLYTSSMNAKAFERLALENSLRKALERKEFRVFYQPQINLDTGEIVGMEALIRWQHPDLGLVAPAQFIPLAEDTGLIVEIGEWVLRTACQQNKAWQAEGYPAVRVSVNLSARQFQQQEMVEMVERVLKDTKLAPEYLELEITESAVMQDAVRAIEILHELNKHGIKVAIDDFGTGYSSLSYLKNFPINRLKIDKVFVHTITTDKNDAAIVAAIIAMSHNLKLKAVAEGVETIEQLDFLRALDCDEMQGYLFSRPICPEDVVKLFSQPPQMLRSYWLQQDSLSA